MKLEKLIDAVNNQKRNELLSTGFTMATGAGLFKAIEQVTDGKYGNAAAYAIAALIANGIANNHKEGLVKRAEEIGIAKYQDKQKQNKKNN